MPCNSISVNVLVFATEQYNLLTVNSCVGGSAIILTPIMEERHRSVTLLRKMKSPTYHIWNSFADSTGVGENEDEVNEGHQAQTTETELRT